MKKLKSWDERLSCAKAYTADFVTWVSNGVLKFAKSPFLIIGALAFILLFGVMIAPYADDFEHWLFLTLSGIAYSAISVSIIALGLPLSCYLSAIIRIFIFGHDMMNSQSDGSYFLPLLILMVLGSGVILLIGHIPIVGSYVQHMILNQE